MKRQFQLPWQDEYYPVTREQAQAHCQERPCVVKLPDGPSPLPVASPQDVQELDALYGSTAANDLAGNLRQLASGGARFYADLDGRRSEVGLYGAYNGLTGDLGLTRVEMTDRWGSLALTEAAQVAQLAAFAQDSQGELQTLANQDFQFFNTQGEQVHPWLASTGSSFSVGRGGHNWVGSGPELTARCQRFDRIWHEFDRDIEPARVVFAKLSGQPPTLEQVADLIEGTTGPTAESLLDYGLEKCQHPAAALLRAAARNGDVFPYLQGDPQPRQLLSALTEQLSDHDFCRFAKAELNSKFLDKHAPEDVSVARPLLSAVLEKSELREAFADAFTAWGEQEDRSLDDGMIALWALFSRSPAGSSDKLLKGAFQDGQTLLGFEQNQSLVAIAQTLLAAPPQSDNLQMVKACLTAIDSAEDRGTFARGVLPVLKRLVPAEKARLEGLSEWTSEIDERAQGRVLAYALTHLDENPAKLVQGAVDSIAADYPEAAGDLAQNVLEQSSPERYQLYSQYFHNEDGGSIFSEEASRAVVLSAFSQDRPPAESALQASAQLEALDLEGKWEDRSALLKATLRMYDEGESTRRVAEFARGFLEGVTLEDWASENGFLEAALRHREARSYDDWLGLTRESVAGAVHDADSARLGKALLERLDNFAEAPAWIGLLRHTAFAANLDEEAGGRIVAAALAGPAPTRPEQFPGFVARLTASIEDEDNHFNALQGALNYLASNSTGDNKKLFDQTLDMFADQEEPVAKCGRQGQSLLEMLDQTHGGPASTADLSIEQDSVRVGDNVVPIHD